MSSVTITNGVEFLMGWRYKLDANTPKPLTGYSVLVQIRAHKEATTTLASYDQDSPYITFTPLTGAVDLVLPPSVTKSFTFTKGVIDCWVYDAVDIDGDRSATYDVVVDRGVSRL